MAKSCILTVIKNEHEYLDEWIKYHLDLGVSHIFIFEDIDSDSHKEICDKYGDKVTLDSVLSVLDETEKEKAKEVKTKKKFNVLHIYYRNALLYLQREHSEYDWCFVIDNDEFIANFDSLASYEGYDAFVMPWKVYGANGYINKPHKGVLEAYTKESESIPSETKTCYKLKTFKKEFLYTHHHPTSLCKYVKSDIYLRHYITKSWEEYVWKRKMRGYTWGGTRDYDFFFKVNQDMLPLKDELIAKEKQEILVVMPYKQSSAQGKEIRIALNGWRKYCQFKYHFIVIGEFDEQLKEEFPWVEFIHCKSIEKKEGQYTPHLDMENKFKIVMKLYSKVYDGFIYTCDDYYAIKPFELKDVTTVHHHSMNFTGCEKCPTSYWRFDKWKTRKLLDVANLPHINYTTHYPYYMQFKKLDEIQKKFNLLQESYVFDDIYFNYFEHEEPVLDSTIRLGIWNNDIFKNEFQKALENPKIKFMCNSVEGWSKELEDNLMKIVS